MIIFLSLSVPSRSYEYQVYRGDRLNNIKMEITPTSKSRENTLLANKKPVATFRVLLNSSEWQKIACNWYCTCVDIVHNKLAYLWDLQNLLLPNIVDTWLNCKNTDLCAFGSNWSCMLPSILLMKLSRRHNLNIFQISVSSLCQHFLRLVSENPFLSAKKGPLLFHVNCRTVNDKKW